MTEELVIGSIVGLAVGDALGYPHEFRSIEQVRRELGPEGITDFVALKDPRFTRPWIVGADHPPGTFTDDTQMSVCVAEALVAWSRSADPTDLESLMREMSERFVRWYDSDANNRSPGETTGVGCRNLRSGVPWREAGVAASKGCGANMRVAPIGLWFSDLDDVASVARDCALMTHGHPAGLEGAAAAALLVALALRGFAPEAMHAEVMQRCAGRSADFDLIFSRVPRLVDRPPEEVLRDLEVVPDGLGEGWVAEEAVASALYCVWRHRDDFAAGVLEAVNTDGDSDSIATIAGSILGARLGIAAIPDRWAAGVEDSAALHDLGHRRWSARR